MATLCLSTPILAGSAPVTVPSGQKVALQEVLLDEAPGALWARFRFLAPAIARDGGTVDYGQAGADMDHLCAALALDYLKQHGISPARVVISLSDRAVEFGAPAPDATQFFEAYRPEDGVCIWEEF